MSKLSLTKLESYRDLRQCKLRDYKIADHHCPPAHVLGALARSDAAQALLPWRGLRLAAGALRDFHRIFRYRRAPQPGGERLLSGTVSPSEEEGPPGTAVSLRKIDLNQNVSISSLSDRLRGRLRVKLTYSYTGREFRRVPCLLGDGPRNLHS